MIGIGGLFVPATAASPQILNIKIKKNLCQVLMILQERLGLVNTFEKSSGRVNGCPPMSQTATSVVDCRLQFNNESGKAIVL